MNAEQSWRDSAVREGTADDSVAPGGRRRAGDGVPVAGAGLAARGRLRRGDTAALRAGRHRPQGPPRRDPPVAARALAGAVPGLRPRRRLAAGRTVGPQRATGPPGAPAAMDRTALRTGHGRPAGLPPGLLLLPQPEELGRPPGAPGRHAAGLGPLALPRPQSRRPAARPAGAARRRLRPDGGLR